MARIAGVDLPRDKRVEIGLTYIYGIGVATSRKILETTGVNPDTRVKDLTEEEEQKLRTEIVNNHTVEGDLRRERTMNIKRLVDIAGGLSGCLMLLPISLAVKLINMKNGDRDPILFMQERIGKDGKPFQIYKYRTMVPDAEQVLEKMMREDEAIREEYLTNKKIIDDPRITKAGAFLRKSSLDELPQLINVLKGEMSLVGPRPYLPREKEDMGSYYQTVIKCRPGITGMWQSHGRSDVGFHDRLKMDEYYQLNWSIWLDIVILIQTVQVVTGARGAR